MGVRREGEDKLGFILATVIPAQGLDDRVLHGECCMGLRIKSEGRAV